ncbi:DUF4350 domain-containing protein [Saliterribacillus persicus]|uniref:Uncharacterized protein DUF4350 n=1 Tax=Saliterribacillus persicus TaxID=930114 RepID=A0A368Y0C5_9BACI|nr:DUF4350 domain-containing protein [Saliterribacillus persicus]RCW73149.1 uncharacterized protein DUF4350 [Saliterribacillus persicus]
MTPKQEKSRIGLLFVLSLLFLIGLSIITISKSPEAFPPYAANSPAPDGTKALYSYLEQEGYQVSRESGLETTETDESIRFLIEPGMFNNQALANEYRQWIEDGNTLVLAKQNPDSMFDIKTTYTDQFFIEDESTTSISDENEQSYEAMVESTVRINTEEQDEILLSDEYGAIALKRQVGSGNLIVLTEPNWLTNEEIISSDHAKLTLYLLSHTESEEIVFDSSQLGHTTSTILTSLYPSWAYVILLEGLLLTILWLWYKGKRFGLIVTPREEYVRFSDERTVALAKWYIKGKNYHESLTYQEDYLKYMLQKRYGIPTSYSWEMRINRLERFLSEEQIDRFRLFHQQFDTFKKEESTNKQAYLKWAKHLHRMQKEVEKE